MILYTHNDLFVGDSTAGKLWEGLFVTFNWSSQLGVIKSLLCYHYTSRLTTGGIKNGKKSNR